MAFLECTKKQFDSIGALTFQTSVLGATTIVTADEKNIQAILVTQFQDFDIGQVRRANFFPLLGNGIFTQDDNPWRHSPAMMRPQFSRDQVSDLDLEERHAQKMNRSSGIQLQWLDRPGRPPEAFLSFHP